MRGEYKIIARRFGGVVHAATSVATSSRRAYLAFCGRHIAAFPYQQPDGDDTPGVAVAPVAFAGAIIPGLARFIVMLSAHADVFGVGITAVVGSMLVPPS
jgi:hypothetical protein